MHKSSIFANVSFLFLGTVLAVSAVSDSALAMGGGSWGCGKGYTKVRGLCESTCGDGIVATDEQCEPTDLAGSTCGSLDFDGGSLECSATCTYDTSACTSTPVVPEMGQCSQALGESTEGLIYSPEEQCTSGLACAEEFPDAGYKICLPVAGASCANNGMCVLGYTCHTPDGLWENSICAGEYSSACSESVSCGDWLECSQGTCVIPELNYCGGGTIEAGPDGLWNTADDIKEPDMQCTSGLACAEEFPDAGYKICLPVAAPEGMALIPAGDFWMGTAATSGGAIGHIVTLDAYYMDIHEVTAGEYKACVGAGGCTVPSTSSFYCSGSDAANNNWDAATNAPISGRENHPVNCVNWNQASDYCAWAGKSLPTEAQWEKAARGGCDVWTTDCAAETPPYPWGGDTPTSSHAVYGLYPSGSTAPVGSKPDGQSPYGLYDMAGNVWEWTADWYSPYTTGPQTNPTGPASGVHKTLRGGGWGLFTYSLRSSGRSSTYPDTSYNGYGFRCAQ
jgi:formylglycine-generating enzyme required for sulfatase activity